MSAALRGNRKLTEDVLHRQEEEKEEKEEEGGIIKSMREIKRLINKISKQ